ncbi:hypothetical protein HD553DRAFT_18939 [Filobasidium floriforme]|uniref:uncharacterized protein n=1 Tax=Filobasidium floriforme TaxID=5210 RepID=UPI001E8D8DA7|nr:uncharacterized protein HD553DRAFT_18939 [Filobasidium floriforme]KAH8090861.1 hypothetical protein HD553DRAFT_18939 [Filobasidium floriforme]
MSSAVPVDPLSRFTYHRNLTTNTPEFTFAVETAGNQRIPRCDQTTLLQLLDPSRAPFPLKEQSTAFYTAQCAHYGLPERKTKEPAKKTLMAAFDQQKGTLRVPAHILAREKQAKKQFEAAAKQIEAEAKKADAAAKKAEEEKRKRMEKFEEIAKVRQRALADLAKVDAFEKKLLGGSAGSSKPKAAGASAAAAMAKKKTPAKQAATAPASTSAAAKKTTNKTTTAGAAPTTKKSATTKTTASAVRTEPDNSHLPFLSDRQPRSYGQAASSSSASFGVQAAHKSGSSVTGRRTKQAVKRSEPASVPSSRVKAEPVVKAEVYETKPTLAPQVQQEYNFHYEYDKYDGLDDADDDFHYWNNYDVKPY